MLCVPLVGAGSGPADTAVNESNANVTIANNLESNGETVEVLVRMGDVPPAMFSANVSAQETLKSQARTSQQSLVDFADRRDGVTIHRQFWIVNAVLLEIETDSVALKEITAIDGVTELRGNERVYAQSAHTDGQTANWLAPTQESTSSTTSAASPITSGTGGPDSTWGLEEINATDVWQTHDTRGDGVSVAVLDTGVDATHQDISLFTENESDPTYPGGWAEFNDSGDIINGSEPYDAGDHGTHVSGTVAGGNASGTHIGVAPAVDLKHGGVLMDCSKGCGGTEAQVLGGVEWAVDSDVDVISLSFGSDEYDPTLIDAIRNAEDAGILVVAAVGNGGNGTSSSPANIYESFAVGMSDSDRSIDDDSSGEEINTSEAWGEAAPDEWPDTYIVPNVVAPGVSVESSVPGDSYDTKSGSSMATPHVSGAAALLLSINPTLEPADIRSILEETAWKPDGEPESQDVRYGHGIIDVFAAAASVEPIGIADGTVTTDGVPVANITVATDADNQTSTDENGQYQLSLAPGEYQVTAAGFGLKPETKPVTIEAGTTNTTNFSLEPSVDATISDDPPAHVRDDTQIDATITATTFDRVTVSLEENSTIDPNDIAIEFDDIPIAANETIDYHDLQDERQIELSVATAAGANGTATFDLEFENGSTNTTVSTETTVIDDLVSVAIVDTNETTGSHLESALDGQLPDHFIVENRTSDLEVAADADVVVFQRHDNETAVDAFFDGATDTALPIVFLDNHQSQSDPIDGTMGISWLSTLTGDPTVDTTDDGDSPVRLNLTSDHELFDGIGTAGDVVPMYNVTDNAGDRAWLSNTTGESIATIGSAEANPDTYVESAISVQDDENRILLTLGGTSRVTNYTSDGERLLANAVEYNAPESKQHVTSSDTFGAETDPGEQLNATVTATTSGAFTVNLSPESTIDPKQVNLTIDGNETAFGAAVQLPPSQVGDTLPIELQTNETARGRVRLSVSKNDSTIYTNTTVVGTEPARYAGTMTINGDSTPADRTIRAILDGNPVSTAPISESRFGYAGGYAAALIVNGTVEDTTSFALEGVSLGTNVTYEPGEIRVIDFELNFTDPFDDAVLDAPRWSAVGTETNVSIDNLNESQRAFAHDVTWTVDGQAFDSTTLWNATHVFNESDEGVRTIEVTIEDLAGETISVDDEVVVINGSVAEITGTLEDPAPADFDVGVRPEHGNWQHEWTVAETGNFDVATDANRSTHVVLSERTGSYPLLETIYLDTPADQVSLGNVTPIEAHEVRIIVTDDAGTPIENATVDVWPASETVTNPYTRSGSTNETGTWTGPTGNDAGISTNGTLTIQVNPPEDDDLVGDTIIRELSIENETMHTIEIERDDDDSNDDDGLGGGGGGGGGGLDGPDTGGDDDDDADDVDNESVDDEALDTIEEDEEPADIDTDEIVDESTNDETDDSDGDSGDDSASDDTIDTDETDSQTPDDSVPGFGVVSVLFAGTIAVGVGYHRLYHGNDTESSR